MDAKEYKKLNRYETYNKEAVEELAEAMNELATITKRFSQLSDLIDENDDLKPFVWTTKDGEAIALHNITDEHLKNILDYFVEQGYTISKSIAAQAKLRKIEIPVGAIGYPPRRIANTVNGPELVEY